MGAVLPTCIRINNIGFMVAAMRGGAPLLSGFPGKVNKFTGSGRQLCGPGVQVGSLATTTKCTLWWLVATPG